VVEGELTNFLSLGHLRNDTSIWIWSAQYETLQAWAQLKGMSSIINHRPIGHE
jgi:hypothetical protein